MYAEIFPGLFHIPHLLEDREKLSSSYFLVRPYGNYLIYGGYTDANLEDFMESKGGVAVQYVSSLNSLNENHIRLFGKFGAPAVVAPGKSAPFHEKIRVVDGPMYQYLDQKIEIFSLDGISEPTESMNDGMSFDEEDLKEDVIENHEKQGKQGKQERNDHSEDGEDHAAVYMVSLGSRKILFCNGLLTISGSGVHKSSHVKGGKRFLELAKLITSDKPDIIFTPFHSKDSLYYILTSHERERISTLLDS